MLRFLLLSLLGSSVVKAAFEQCGDDDDDFKCYNDGKCVLATDEEKGDIWTCQCSEEPDDDGHLYNGVHCAKQVPDSDRFCNFRGDYCMHQGTCNEDISQLNPKVCICPDEYVGRHCQLEANSTIVQHFADEDGGCNYECLNDGQCEFGHKTEKDIILAKLKGDDDEDSSVFYQHCQCAPGFTGDHCEVEVAICGDINDDRAWHFCHHGGTCVETLDYWHLDELPEDTPPYMCDCSTSDHYVGSWCNQQIGPGMTMCNQNDPHANTHFMCYHGGTCVEGEDGSALKCDCTGTEYRGRECEVKQNEALPFATDDDYDCSDDLTCLNGGECAFGLADHNGTVLGSLMNQAHNKDLEHLFARNHPRFEHCVCPSGYAGEHCGHQFEACSDDFACFHGSRCVDKEDGDHKCSCNEDDSDLALAGEYCQHQATSFCDDEPCYNDADCVDGYCECKEGFKGPQCEFSEDMVFDSQDDDLAILATLTAEHTVTSFDPTLIVFLTVGGTLALLSVVYAVHSTRAAKETIPGSETAGKPDLPPSYGDVVSSNGNGNGGGEMEMEQDAKGEVI